MNDKFFELKREKQDKIINAALKVFSANSYKHASTDDIVKEANISKGLLFHYFENKEGVFSFILDYSVRFVGLELYTCISIKEDDYFQLLMQIEQAHYNVLRKYPFMLAFLKTIEHEPLRELNDMVDKKTESLKDAYASVYARADMNFAGGKGRSGQVVRMVQYMLDGIDEEYENTLDATIDDVYKQKIKYLTLVEDLVK